METLFLQMKRIGREQVAQIGTLKFYETEYSLEKATEETRNALFVEHQFLLPFSTDEYISLEDASLRSGLSIQKLRSLCAKGNILNIHEGNELRIHWQSLSQYLNR